MVLISELLQLLNKEFPRRSAGPKHYIESRDDGEPGFTVTIYAEQKKHVSGLLLSTRFTVELGESDFSTSATELVAAFADIFYNTNWSAMDCAVVIEQPDIDPIECTYE